MKYQLAVVIICFQAIVTTSGFAQAPAKAPAPAVKEDPPPALAVPKGFVYQDRGRRDPFLNPIPPPPPAPLAPPKPIRPPGMKGADVAEVTILGVLIGKTDPSMTRAILQVPGMKAPVMASRGDVLFDGVIKEIRQDAVVFTMVPPGNAPRNPLEEKEVVRKLRSTAGDKK